jgi:hypothetical protein
MGLAVFDGYFSAFNFDAQSIKAQARWTLNSTTTITKKVPQERKSELAPVQSKRITLLSLDRAAT